MQFKTDLHNYTYRKRKHSETEFEIISFKNLIARFVEVHYELLIHNSNKINGPKLPSQRTI